jgi:PAS domain S-box-containing protein
MNNTIKRATPRSSTIQKLKLELAEKEAILHAIQSGEIDALVTKNERGEQRVLSLQGSELTYQILIESMNEGAITVTKDGTIIYCNKKFSELVHLSAEEIIGKTLFQYIQKSDRAKLKEILLKLKIKSVKKILKLISSNGSLRTVHFSCKSMQLPTTNAISIVITDLSEIQEIEQRYSTLVENASCGIMIHDYDGIILEVNKLAETILGRTKKQIIGNDLRNFLPVKEKNYATVLLQKMKSETSIGPNEGQLQRPDGEVRDIIFSITRISYNGKDLLLGVITDITERNQLRTQALLNDRLTVIGTLATGLVHEINNPIAYIQSNFSYLKDKILKLSLNAENQDQIKLQLVQAIAESVEGLDKIKEIISDLKGFARVKGEIFLPFNINDVLESAIKMASPQFNNIQIRKIFSSDIPMMLSSKNKFHQVVLNLLVNAAQAMDDTSLNNVITLRSYLDDSNIYIDISDTGKGIPVENISKIFEPFFTTKPVGIGTGLGLSLCHDIMQSLGGSISVKSVVNSGSTFSICLPLQLRAHDENISLSKKDQSNFKKILVINDDPSLSIVITKLLEKIFHVSLIKSGREALHILEKKVDFYDIIISNFSMNDIDGKDIYEYYVRKNHPQLFIFIIDKLNDKLTSGINGDDNVSWIDKSFTQGILLDAVEKLLIK